MKRYVFSLLLFPVMSLAANPEFSMAIENHRFSPSELKVPANQKIRLQVANLDRTPEEFESYSLNREKVIPGNAKATIYIGPLAPGKYVFFGDFHEDSAHGVIVAE
jgi:Cupredoxin-like domain